MKKKIFVSLGIIFTILFILQFFFIASIKKMPVTSETYSKVMNANGVQVHDYTYKLDEDFRKFVSSEIYADNNIGVFTECYDNKKAAFIFDYYYNSVVNQYQNLGITEFYNIVDFSNSHYQYKSFNAKEDYFVIIRVENTIFQIAVGKEGKNKADLLIKDLGYDINLNFTALMIFNAFCAIGILIVIIACFMSIFKKHQIHPLLVFVPFVSFYYFCKIADKNGWKMLFFLIPFFNFFYYFVLMYKLSKIYTDSKIINCLIGFLPLVFLPVIAFDEPRIKEKPKNIYEQILEESENQDSL